MRPPSGRTAVGIGYGILLLVITALLFSFLRSSAANDARFHALRKSFDQVVATNERLSTLLTELQDCVKNAGSPQTDCKALTVPVPQITVRTERGGTTIVIPTEQPSTPAPSSGPRSTPKPRATPHPKPRPTPAPTRTPVCVAGHCVPDLP